MLCYIKDWATLLHLIYFHFMLPVTNHLITKLSVTNDFSVCREYLTKNRLSFPSAPCWVRHSYLSKGLRVTPTMRLYLSRVEARLRGITALWFCRKKGHLHTIPCNEQEWDKELAYNRHFTQ